MQTKELTFNELAITQTELYQQMGYGGSTPDEGVRSELQAVVDEVATWIRPRYCYTVCEGMLTIQPDPTLRVHPTPSTPSEATEDILLPLSPIIARQLRGATAFAFFVCTAGSEFEQYQQRLKQENDLLRTFLADALGSVIAERCADRMEESLQDSIDKLHWHRTNRFSPGYCGWHVSEQQRLFSLFPTANPCGIRLTDSSLMIPIKSVSGIIGIGKNVRHLDYSCGLCNYSKCYKKRRRNNATE
jgi:hypothetical protein